MYHTVLHLYDNHDFSFLENYLLIKTNRHLFVFLKHKGNKQFIFKFVIYPVLLEDSHQEVNSIIKIVLFFESYMYNNAQLS